MFAAGCGRLFEGTPEQMWTALSKLVALDQNTLVYCGHEYTLSNLRFAQAVEPGNHDIEARVVNERGKRERDMPTLPSTVGAERATNPFVRANLPHVMASA
jgi:hydroxyacylglutathione hydrolase